MRHAAILALGVLLCACPTKPNYPECKTDGDCESHTEVCLNGFCKQCRDDSNCPADKPLCKDALCTAKPVAKAECTPETAAQDCGAGRKCVEGRCAAEEVCDTDADCGEGRACVERRCVSQSDILASHPTKLVGECEVRAIYFGFDDATLSPESRKVLGEDWDCLQKSPFRRVVLSGHTDERGTTEYNLALGMRRADAVKRYLAQLGAEAKRLKAISFGKERPVAKGHDESAWSKNRRVELNPEAP